MIQDEIKAFELELEAVMKKSKSLKINIGTKQESIDMRRSIEELDELKKEAAETVDSLRNDVQSNRLGMTEMFSMVYEARAKFDSSKKEKSIFINQSHVQDRASKRTLERLVKQVSQCEMQLQVSVQVMNSQWANYQDATNKSKKNRMHNPSLEGLYQTLTKQQAIIYCQHEKMTLLKSKLGLRDHIMKQKSALSSEMESYSDSMISIALRDQVENENRKLTNKKLKNLRNLLAGREVVTIKPQRPDRAGLNSEIVREKKLHTLKMMKKVQTTTTSLMQPPSSLLNQNSQQRITTPGTSMSTTSAKPSFGLSVPLNTASNERKRDESSMLHSQGTNPGQHHFGSSVTKPGTEAFKNPSTIANTNVAISASFSIPLAMKVAPSIQPKVVEKKQDGGKPLTSDENASFTFKLSDKKEELLGVKPTSSLPPLFSSTGDSTKAFSFGSSSYAAPLSSGFKGSEISTSSIFEGTSSTTTPSISVFARTTPTSFSGFGSGFSSSLGEESSNPSKSSGFSSNFNSTNDSGKSTTAPSGFSFSALSTSSVNSTVGESKPTTITALKVQPPSFGGAFSQATNKSPADEVSSATTT